MELINEHDVVSSDEPSPPALRVTSQRSYKVTKGLQKTRRPLFNKHNTKSTAAKKTAIGSSKVKTVPVKSEIGKQTTTILQAQAQRSDAPEAEEARETEDDASQAIAPTDDTESSIHRVIQDAGEREGVDVETSNAYDNMSIQLNKLNESAFQIYNQTVNGLTTAYVKAGEDLSLIGLALTQTKAEAAKSLNELMKGHSKEKNVEEEHEGAEPTQPSPKQRSDCPVDLDVVEVEDAADAAADPEEKPAESWSDFQEKIYASVDKACGIDTAPDEEMASASVDEKDKKKTDAEKKEKGMLDKLEEVFDASMNWGAEGREQCGPIESSGKSLNNKEKDDEKEREEEGVEVLYL